MMIKTSVLYSRLSDFMISVHMLHQPSAPIGGAWQGTTGENFCCFSRELFILAGGDLKC